jgi:hypothetical protein
MAGSVTLAWDASPSTNVAGYYLHSREADGEFSRVLTVTNGLTGTVTNLQPGVKYFFVATAFNEAGLESDPSNEVWFTLPPTDAVFLTKMATNLSRTNVTLVGYVDKIPGEFGAFFEWVYGTDFSGEATAVIPAQLVYTNGTNLTITADMPVTMTNYTYHLVVTNAAHYYTSAAVTFSTIPPKPVQLRFQVTVIQTASLGDTGAWKDVLVAEVPVPYPSQDHPTNAIYAAKMSWEIDYDHNIPVPPYSTNIVEDARLKLAGGGGGGASVRAIPIRIPSTP